MNGDHFFMNHSNSSDFIFFKYLSLNTTMDFNRIKPDVNTTKLPECLQITSKLPKYWIKYLLI